MAAVFAGPVPIAVPVAPLIESPSQPHITSGSFLPSQPVFQPSQAISRYRSPSGCVRSIKKMVPPPGPVEPTLRGASVVVVLVVVVVVVVVVDVVVVVGALVVVGADVVVGVDVVVVATLVVVLGEVVGALVVVVAAVKVSAHELGAAAAVSPPINNNGATTIDNRPVDRRTQRVMKTPTRSVNRPITMRSVDKPVSGKLHISIANMWTPKKNHPPFWMSC